MTAGWVPTHVAPGDGLRAWPTPDGSASDGEVLGPGLPLVIMQTSGGWSQVQASNGWVGWVSAALLVPIDGRPPPPGPAASEQPVDGGGDPEVLAQLEAAAATCEAALDRFERGEIDLAAFQAIALDAAVVRTEGLMWVLDWEKGEWFRFDGFSLRAISSLSEEPAAS